MKMGLTSSPLRRRNCFLAFILVLVPCTILFLVIGTGKFKSTRFVNLLCAHISLDVPLQILLLNKRCHNE